MLGYPGAGKTTTAKAIHENTGAVHLWADLVRRDMFRTPTYSHTENIQLYEHLNNLVSKYLSAGEDVIFDTSFNFYKDRERLRTIAKEHDAEAFVVWVTTNKGIARKRATNLVGSHDENSKHNHHTRVLADMPVEDFERMSGNLEEPRPNEKVIEVDGTKVTRDYIAELLAKHGLTGI